MQTFLFTDIEGSTRLWESYPEEMRQALQHHDALLRTQIEEAGGQVFKTIGDAFCTVFPEPVAALRACLQIQRALQSQPLTFAGDSELRVRIALHSGTAEARDHDYFGPTLNRVARLLAVGHGGQVLLSETTASVLGEACPADCTLRDLGQHTLKDIEHPETIYQLCHPQLLAEFPPLRTEPSRRSSLPTPLTSLVGREAERALLCERVPQARLLTLLGAGGTGKTRLALEAAHQLAATTHFLLVLFLGMEEETDPLRLWPLLASQLERLGVALPSPLPGSGPEDIPRRVVAALGRYPTLLVLDNLEQLDNQTLHPLLRFLLEQAPSVRLLVTSRRRLSLRGEQVITLSPLSTEAGVALFLERVRQLRPEFEASDETLAQVRTLCQRLDGLPLALEMAAARTGVLSLGQILTRIEDRFDLLVNRSKDVPARQLSLHATIEWSYELLSPEAQRFLPLLAVFRGGWCLEAAEAVGGELALDASDELQAASLLVIETTPEPRYRLLEAVRSFARSQLTPEAWDAVRQRHAEWYLAQLRQDSPQMKSPRERENILQAMAHLRQTRQLDSLATMLLSQLGYWWVYAGFDEAREQLGGYIDACLAAGAGGETPLSLLAHLLHLELYQQRLESATTWLAKADSLLPASERENNPEWLLALAHWHEKAGQLDEALALNGRCDSHPQTPAHIREQARISQIWTYLRLGRAQEALQHCQQTLAHHLQRTTAPDSQVATLYYLQAIAHLQQEELPAARLLLDKSQTVLETLRFTSVENIVCSVEATWLLASGHYEAAWERATACLLPLWRQRDFGRVLVCLDTLAAASWLPDRKHLTPGYLRILLAVETLLPYHRTAFERRGTQRLLERVGPLGALPASREELDQLVHALPKA